MGEYKGFGRHVWKLMLALSIVLLLWTVFMMSRGDNILPTAFRLAGSPQLTQDIERRAPQTVVVSRP